MNQDYKGGAALAFIELVLNMHMKHDIECVVLTGHRNKINEICDKNSIENHTAHFRNFLSSPRKPVFLWKYLIGIRNRIGSFIAKFETKKININSFDIIHTNLDRIDFGAELSVLYKKPHVWHIREHLDGYFNIITHKKDFVKYMNSFNSDYIAISNSVKKRWIRRGIRENKIYTIYDGVETKIIPKKVNWFQNDKVHLLFLGGITDAKGQLLFLKSIQSLPQKYKNEFDISFYGDGSLVEITELLEFAKKNNISCYHYKYVDNIYSLISDYDIGINYSENEGFGRVTVEYMAAGLCVIAARSGATPEIVDDKINGFLVSRNNPSELINILELLLNNRKKIIKTGEAAQTKAEQFSMQKHTAQVYQLYQMLIRK